MYRIFLLSILFFSACGPRVYQVNEGPKRTRSVGRTSPKYPPKKPTTTSSSSPSRGGKQNIIPPSSLTESRCQKQIENVKAVASKNKLDWTLLAAIITIESRWNPKAKNASGASGLMQIMPSTGKGLGCGSLMDARKNIECGARLLTRLNERYDGNTPYVLGAYATGAKRADASYKARRQPVPEGFISKIMALAPHFAREGCGVFAG